MKAIYTVITGNYDTLNHAPRFDDWDKILFCDEDIDPKGWELRKLKKSDDPLLQSRDIKIRSHIHLKEYDLVCYIDGHQIFVTDPPKAPIWFRHSRRKTIFEEAEQIIKNGRFTAEEINQQVDFYKKNGYEDCELYLNGFFVRRHSEKINNLHNIWYEETKRFTQRDQLSLPFAIWKSGTFPEGIHNEEIKYNFAHVKYAHQ